MKRILILCWLILIFSSIAYVFWHTDWKYNLPTPVPKGYHFVNHGVHVDLPEKLIATQNKPLFIHFFNPDCPCSRFNIPHFKSLIKQYGDRLSFVIVVLNKNNTYTEKKIQDKFNIDVPVLFDSSVAAACGVYSTPQAVLLDAQHNLYYRGNYNKSRYCINRNTNYAQMAIDTFLNNHPCPVFNAAAFTAYGCQLPTCNKN